MKKFIKTWEAFTKDKRIGEIIMARIEKHKQKLLAQAQKDKKK